MSIFQYSPRFKGLTVFGLLPAHQAQAHAAEQGFVLLLPTDAYIVAGTACVALTVLLLTILPDRLAMGLFRPARLTRWIRCVGLRRWTSCLSFGVLAVLIWAGLNGSRDPLSNPLPLTVWTVWWVALVTLQGMLGDLWRWLNPWSGPVALTRHLLRLPVVLRLPTGLGQGCALVTFLGFAVFLLADPAPADPARLAVIVMGYWLFTYLALLAFGPRWHWRGEGISMLMRNYATLGLFGRTGRNLGLGATGWQAIARRPPQMGEAVFMVVMLGSGSFDGLNETFWWLDLMGINPLEFPGRSAVTMQNAIGLIAANAALVAAYGLAIWLGMRLIGGEVAPGRAFCLMAPSILPIALGYHIAHYLPSFLVDGQYVLAVLNDPLARGSDLLGLGTFYVTTGFFNAADSVRVIWLSQAGAVVIGHVLAVIMAHAIAVRAFGDTRRAALFQTPLAVFMLVYTLFGLWLLASPRGV
ncbi:hypothetical protein [Sedimentitalea nanhaiensis]|uniref:Uncharacterized protein n=1 Tax=Sedimentitalea nanhaiensis TaxID=999627 RepID=A0A1I7BNX1_9RHOB|nr:hypothetical protein [Sedimentitalea nanhaiensis]SFT88894.1 hypothetical protein SAMN05216236_11160 [Sedimentitalea nanhaiensis]